MATSPLFIDIETISSTPTYNDLSPRMQQQWLLKAERLGATTAQEKQDLFFQRAGIFAEFGKIIVIAMGYITQNQTLRIQGLAGHNEQQLLQHFRDTLQQFPSTKQLCGHNSKEFDIPYLCRRMLVQSIPLPASLNIAGKKPWEINHLDTMELWRFGDYKNYTSLDLLTTTFNISSSKDNMAGSDVNTYYYEKKDLPAITQYCMKDVIATAQLYRRLKLLPPLDPNNIEQHVVMIPINQA